MFSDIKITLKPKLQAKGDLCRLCGNLADSCYLSRVFSNSRMQKNRPRKVFQMCGVVISGTDYLPKVIRRKCGNFMNKMWEFREQIQKAQVTMRQQFSFKCGIATSPTACKQPAKPTHLPSNDDNNTAKTTLDLDKVIPSQGLHYRTHMNIPICVKLQTPCVQCFCADNYTNVSITYTTLTFIRHTIATSSLCICIHF